MGFKYEFVITDFEDKDRKLIAIKSLKNLINCGLKQSKQYIDCLLEKGHVKIEINLNNVCFSIDDFVNGNFFKNCQELGFTVIDYDLFEKLEFKNKMKEIKEFVSSVFEKYGEIVSDEEFNVLFNISLEIDRLIYKM